MIQVTFTISEDVSAAEVEEAFGMAFNPAHQGEPRLTVGRGAAAVIFDIAADYTVAEKSTLCPGSLRANGPCEHGEYDVHRVAR